MSRKVLVVDDEKLIVKGIRFSLEQDGMDVDEIVGKLVLECSKAGYYLQDVPLERYQEISSIIGPDIYTALESQTAVSRRNSLGGTGFESIRWQIQQAKEQLSASKGL